MDRLNNFLVPYQSKNSDLLGSPSFGAFSSSGYHDCCPSVVDPQTLLALLASKNYTYNIRFKNKKKFGLSPFKQHFFLIAIGLATYFLRLQIIILMRGKRSTGNENILEEFRIVLDDHIGEMQFEEEIFRIPNLSDEN